MAEMTSESGLQLEIVWKTTKTRPDLFQRQMPTRGWTITSQAAGFLASRRDSDLWFEVVVEK